MPTRMNVRNLKLGLLGRRCIISKSADNYGLLRIMMYMRSI